MMKKSQYRFMNQINLKMPARDRAKARDLAYYGKFRLLEGLASTAKSHVWRAVDRDGDREVVLKILRTANGSTLNTFGECFDAALPCLPRVFDSHSSNRFGDALLMESLTTRSLTGLVHERKVGLRSAHAAVFVTDLVGAARAAFANGLCLGSIPLDNMAISSTGNLVLFGQRNLHRSSAIAGGRSERSCCLLGVESRSLFNLIQATMPEGFRRAKLVTELRQIVMTQEQTSEGQSLVHDAMLLALADSVSVASRSSVASLAEIPAAGEVHGRGVSSAHESTSRRASILDLIRQVSWLKRIAFRKVFLGLGISAVLVALCFWLVPGSDLPRDNLSSGASVLEEQIPKVQSASPPAPTGDELIPVPGSEQPSLSGTELEYSEVNVNDQDSDDPIIGTRWIISQVQACSTQNETDEFSQCVDHVFLDPIASVEREIADFVLQGGPKSSPSEVELIDFMGGTALTSAVWRAADGSVTTTASLLIVKSEAGWRLRAFY